MATSTSDLERRGLRLEYLTVAWNVIEAVVAAAAGAIENNADQPAGPDHDELITSLRQIIIDLYFEIEAPDLHRPGPLDR